MPKTPKDESQYLDLDALSPFEREVFDLAIAALTLPMTARHAWFGLAARQMQRVTAATHTDTTVQVAPRKGH